ncbi:MAG: HU family DNA-binding protein [Sumerlaeia bacterium]
MTKAEVANLVMERTGRPRNECFQAVEIFLDSVKDALKKGEKVSLVGFGTFIIKTRNARQGRNPRTSETISIPEKRVVAFKPGKSFREAVNDGTDIPGGGKD